MKAIIFNSGIGKRMGELTKNNHKSMVQLNNGETIFERQIRILSECGIKEFVVTTGKFEQCFKDITEQYQDIKVTYVNNPIYDKTNYIYSFYLTKNYLDDDFVMLHGDLVFNKELAKKVINSKYESCVTIDKTKSLPDKDFKGRLIGDILKEVSINIFDENCFALQPFYKLSKKDINTWMDRVVDFIENKHIDGVYAENAMNEVSDNMNITFFDASKDFVEEIDNLEDYRNVTNGIKYFDYKEQEVYHSLNEIKSYFKNPFIVLDSFLKDKIKLNGVIFSDFQPNPLYDDVVKAIKLFKKNKCDGLISIGGGSAIDTAKTIKYFIGMDESKCYIGQENVYINIKHIACPTTAGSGSESTRYAVVYYNGIKQSITQDSIVPNGIVIDCSFLETLPQRQKIATLFDALCQSIESLWSINCNKMSQEYAKESIHLIMQNMEAYLNGDKTRNELIAKAANLSGKAINITQTTVAHAMSYKITSLFEVPHGEAVAMCMATVMKKVVTSINTTSHPLGKDYLYDVLLFLKDEFKLKNDYELDSFFDSLYKKYMIKSYVYSDFQIDELVNSVNLDRLVNFPFNLSKEEITNMYKKILG